MEAQAETEIQAGIERRLEATFPEVEVLLVEVGGGPRSRTVRVFIDHPDGVNLALCEQVTRALTELLSDYGLEVSSPGVERPLTKPDHFRRYAGQSVRLRTREAIDGQRNFRGELVSATADALKLSGEVAGRDGVITIPYEQVARANLLESGESS